MKATMMETTREIDFHDPIVTDRVVGYLDREPRVQPLPVEDVAEEVETIHLQNLAVEEILTSSQIRKTQTQKMNQREAM